MNVSVGDSFYLSAIGWTCEYGSSKKGGALSCNPGRSGGKVGDPLVGVSASWVVVLGESRPTIATLNTSSCCLRISRFPARSPGSKLVVAESDLNLAPTSTSGDLGSSVSVRASTSYAESFRPIPDHHDPGPVFYCDRQSVRSAKISSSAMEASKYHMSATTSPPQK